MHPLTADGLMGLTYQEASNRINNPNFEYDPAGNMRRGSAISDSAGNSATVHRYVY